MHVCLDLAGKARPEHLSALVFCLCQMTKLILFLALFKCQVAHWPAKRRWNSSTSFWFTQAYYKVDGSEASHPQGFQIGNLPPSSANVEIACSIPIREGVLPQSKDVLE